MIIRGKWIDGGSTFRVWYVADGKIRKVDAAGATSWQIQKAMRMVKK